MEPSLGKMETAGKLRLNVVKPGHVNRKAAVPENTIGKFLGVPRLPCALEKKEKRTYCRDA